MPLIWKQAVGENWKGFNLNVVRWKKKMKALKSCWNGQQKWELQTQQFKTLLALATVWAILSPSLISRRQVGELQTELCLFEWNIYNFSCMHIIFSFVTGEDWLPLAILQKENWFSEFQKQPYLLLNVYWKVIRNYLLLLTDISFSPLLRFFFTFIDIMFRNWDFSFFFWFIFLITKCNFADIDCLFTIWSG